MGRRKGQGFFDEELRRIDGSVVKDAPSNVLDDYDQEFLDDYYPDKPKGKKNRQSVEYDEGVDYEDIVDPSDFV